MKFFPNQSHGSVVFKHEQLPVFATDEFCFYRCIHWEDRFYGKTVSELFSGNIRPNNRANRYSALFPMHEISYWADAPQTAKAEYFQHNLSKNLLMFEAYDDVSSTVRTAENQDRLYIIDGRSTEFGNILKKCDSNVSLSNNDMKLLAQIEEFCPDVLAFRSHAYPGGINYLFFESGFKKLSIRRACITLGDRKSRNRYTVECASGSDFIPNLESYGKYFLPHVKCRMSEAYLLSNEYKERKKNAEKCQNDIRKEYLI